MERPSPAYLLRAAGIDENTKFQFEVVDDPLEGQKESTFKIWLECVK